jgi:glutaredoxin
MLDSLRHNLYRAITTPRGDRFLPVRVQKDLARRLNSLLGQPICSKEEIARRRQANERLATLRTTKTVTPKERLAAPVLVYFEKDRNARERSRVEELLNARGFAFKLLDVSGDEATIDFVTRAAHCQRDELPVVFVADKVIGGYRALVDADVSGDLEKAVFGTVARPS